MEKASEGARQQAYESWLEDVPRAITMESMWQFYAYRKALYLHDLCWEDCVMLLKHPLGRPIANQLIRAVGSISANIEEGYGRGWGKDHYYFLRIALGSARESKGWYYRAKQVLSAECLDDRHHLLGEIIALLVTELNRHKSKR